MIRYMTCTACKSLVQVNATGICLGCQGGFSGQQEADRYIDKETQLEHVNQDIAELVNRQKELVDAIKIASPKSMDACKQTEASKGVRKSNSKREKATKKGKKE